MLVGGLVAIFYFPIYWVANHPNWLSYFSEGWPNHQPGDMKLKSQFLVQQRGPCCGILQADDMAPSKVHQGEQGCEPWMLDYAWLLGSGSYETPPWSKVPNISKYVEIAWNHLHPPLFFWELLHIIERGLLGLEWLELLPGMYFCGSVRAWYALRKTKGRASQAGSRWVICAFVVPQSFLDMTVSRKSIV